MKGKHGNTARNLDFAKACCLDEDEILPAGTLNTPMHPREWGQEMQMYASAKTDLTKGEGV